MPDETLKIILTADTAGLVTGSKSSVDALKRVSAQVDDTRARMLQLKRSADELGQVSRTVGLVGAAIAGPLLAAATAYVNKTGQAEATSRKWLASTNELESSYARVGRVAAQTVGPILSQLADLSSKAASFAEAHPAAIQAALGIGGGLVALGALGSIAAQGIKIVADVKLLGAAALQDTAADKMLAAAQLQAGVGQGAVAGGGGGTNWGEGLNRVASIVGIGIIAAAANWATTSAAKSAFGTFEHVTGTDPNTGGAYGFEKNLLTNYGPMGPGQIQALGTVVQQLTATLGHWINGSGGVGAAVYGPPAPLRQMYSGGAQRTADQTAADQAAGRLADSRAAAVPLYQQYQSSQNDALGSYIQTRTAAVDDFTKQSIDALASYNQARARQIRDFNESEARTEKSYDENRLRQLKAFNEQQAEAQQQFDEDQARSASQHSTDIARLAQDQADSLAQLSGDHEERVRELAGQGDALGLVREQRSYERQKAEMEANGKKEIDRRNQDFNTQQADAKQAFEEQRTQQAANFKEQQDDAKADYDEQRGERANEQRQRLDDMAHDFKGEQDKARDQQKVRLDALDDNFQKEKDKREDLFKKQLTQLDAALTGQTRAQADAYAATSKALDDFLKGMVGQVTGGGQYTAPLKPGDKGYDPTKDPFINFGGAHKSTGGYAGHMVTMLGEQGTEFVLSNQSVTAAERLISGPLTQDKILAAIGRANQSYSVNFGNITATWGDRATAKEQIMEMIDGRIGDAFNQFAQEAGR